jgi:hypothetical protein
LLKQIIIFFPKDVLLQLLKLYSNSPLLPQAAPGKVVALAPAAVDVALADLPLVALGAARFV